MEEDYDSDPGSIYMSVSHNDRTPPSMMDVDMETWDGVISNEEPSNNTVHDKRYSDGHFMFRQVRASSWVHIPPLYSGLINN